MCGFNRTFMELKYTIKFRNNKVGCGFNRTFMELKSRDVHLITSKIK